MNKISVVINTINEEKNLPRALASVKDLAGEIVVVDMHSNDKTVEIAKKAGAKVYDYERTGYVEPARNFAISKATGDWIFVLDADEEIPASLLRWILNEVKKPQADYYRIPRKNIIFGKWMKRTSWWPDYNIRFFRNGNVSWTEIIHAVPITVGKGTDLIATEENAIIHFHYTNINQFIERMNRYTTIQLNVLKDKKVNFSWRDIILKPQSEFLRRFFAEEGYKDGIHGLALSSLQAFSELVLYLKLWEIDKFKIKSKFNLINYEKTIKNTVKEHMWWLYNERSKNTSDVFKKLWLKITKNLKYQ